MYLWVYLGAVSYMILSGSQKNPWSKKGWELLGFMVNSLWPRHRPGPQQTLSDLGQALPSQPFYEQIPRDSGPREKQAGPQELTRTLATGFLVWPKGASNPLATLFQAADLHIPPSFSLKGLDAYCMPDTVRRALHMSRVRTVTLLVYR